MGLKNYFVEVITFRYTFVFDIIINKLTIIRIGFFNTKNIEIYIIRIVVYIDTVTLLIFKIITMNYSEWKINWSTIVIEKSHN